MKRTIAKIIILILIFVLAGCDTQETGTMVCLGDSLTEGYGASRPFEVDKSKSYPAFLQQKVKLTVLNSGISGNTAADGLDRIDKDVLAKDPQVVIILLGANDFLRRKPANEAKSNLQAVINKISDMNRKIYLASFIGDAAWENSYLETYSFIITPEIIALLANYKKIYAELSSENKDIGYISNIWKGIGKDHMSDPIHPNAKGYSIMADNIFAEIKPFLAENNLLK